MNQTLQLQLQKYEKIQNQLATLHFPEIEVVPVPPKQRLENVLLMVLPFVGSDESEIIRAEVLASLVVEGFAAEERETVSAVICESIEHDADKKSEALAVARRILGLAPIAYA